MRKIETFASASLKTEVRGERIEVRKPREDESSQSPSAASIASRCQHDCVAPVPLRGLILMLLILIPA